ncbi:MAG: histidinol-phosphate transaminase [Bacteroidetes bacterium]|nr:histidinol-phosphate transaminase [Bacteroidota bacterium]
MKVVKLSANENCYGCSSLALDAILSKYKDVHLYPDVNPITLKEKLSEKFGVRTDNIIVGAGSVRIIDGLIQTLVGEGEEVLTFENSFIAYGQFSEFHKRKCRFAPLSDFRCVPENLLPFINDNTRLIFIANPNNPTGTIISHSELEWFLSKISEKIIVVIDEAYAEYVTDASFPNSFELQKKYSNLVVLRSFSKIYGLAGLRIGYGIMEEKIAAMMNEKQIPFSVNYLSPATAIAALSDVDFINRSVVSNSQQREYLFDELLKLGYNAIFSHANFIYLWFDNDVEKEKFYSKLFQEGIVICDMKVFGQAKSLRITIGVSEINRKIISFLKEN